MAEISISTALRQFGALPKKLEQANRLAISTTARRGRVHFQRAIAAELPLKKKDIGAKLFVRQNGYDWIIGTPRLRGIPLQAFPHIPIGGWWKGKGIAVTVRFSQGQQTYAHAFRPVPIAPSAATLRGIDKFGYGFFERQSGASRYPIRQLYGPSISTIFTEVMPAMIVEIEKIYKSEMARQLERTK